MKKFILSIAVAVGMLFGGFVGNDTQARSRPKIETQQYIIADVQEGVWYHFVPAPNDLYRGLVSAVMDGRSIHYYIYV